MPTHTWILTDNGSDVAEAPAEITSSDAPDLAGDWKIQQRVLRGGLSDGVHLVEIDNGQMRVFVLPTRGMGIWKVEVGDDVLGWRSPVRGPVHPGFVPLYDPSGLGWLDGFDEFLVRCGLESNGAPDFNEQGQLLYPLHGRIANRPAHHVEVTVNDEAETITLLGIVEETRFHFQKLRLISAVTIPLDGTTLSISDSVENFGGTPAEMQMLYHINIGEPLLSPGDEFVAPIQAVKHRDKPDEELASDWDKFHTGTAGKPEDCYFMEMQPSSDGLTRVLLKNHASDKGVAIGYNSQQLPCFALWKNDVASQDGYVTGLEPATNFPNCRSIEKAAGRVVTLGPGEKWSADLQIDYLSDEESVSAIESEIAALSRRY